MNANPFRRVLLIFSALVLLAGAGSDAFAGLWQDRSRQHENDCNTWCRQNSGECAHCSTLYNCGAGFERMRSWDGYGQNWHACRHRTTYRQATEQNQAECIGWCNNNRDQCEKCSTHIGCGAGYDHIQTFGGRGDNYFACRRRVTTQARLDDCEQWCGNNKPRCEHCTQRDGCGPGYKVMESFRGSGVNYFACEDRGSSEQNQTDCYNWCNQNREGTTLNGLGCHHCSRTPGCGAGLTAIKSWRDGGKNWYACGNRGYLSEKNKQECYVYCGGNDDCDVCFRVAGCGTGYKQLKSFTGKGDNWYACQDRGGSENNHQRCKDYCYSNELCKRCSRYATCGYDELMETFGGEGHNWYACREKVRRGGELKAPE